MGGKRRSAWPVHMRRRQVRPKRFRPRYYALVRRLQGDRRGGPTRRVAVEWASNRRTAEAQVRQLPGVRSNDRVEVHAAGFGRWWRHLSKRSPGGVGLL